MVVVDAPATGHGLALLAAPRTFADAAHVGPIARQGRRIAATLADRSVTALAAVATPEQAAIDELLHLRAQLGGELDATIVNAAAAERFSGSDTAVLERAAADPAARPEALAAIALARREAARTLAERSQIARLDSAVVLPLLASDGLAVTELGVLAAGLEGAA